jgi:hypothetical protein
MRKGPYEKGTLSVVILTHIFRNGKPSYDGDRNPEENHKLWSIGSTERYILHIQVLLGCCNM